MFKKYEDALKNKKGVAGLDVLLAVITFLFMIGLLVMILAVVGGELKDVEAASSTSSGNVYNETVTLSNSSFGGNTTSVHLLRSLALSSVVVTNYSDGVTLTTDNYTLVTDTFTSVVNGTAENLRVNLTFAYTYKYYNTAGDVMNSTTNSLSGVVDWFDIIIVLAAVVVLILLTVIIIRAIRGSGMMGGSGGSGNGEFA